MHSLSDLLHFFHTFLTFGKILSPYLCILWPKTHGQMSTLNIQLRLITMMQKRLWRTFLDFFSGSNFWGHSFSFGRKGDNVYFLVRHVPFIAKGAGFLLQCTKCLRQVRQESCTERYCNMTNQQIYFSGWTRFVHTSLGLICDIWINYLYSDISNNRTVLNNSTGWQIFQKE